MKNIIRQSSSFIAPVVVCLIIPYLIVRSEHRSPVPVFTSSSALLILGFAVCIGALALFITTVRMFILIGNGTIMPWDPTRKLIVASLYRHVRNPMILSLILFVAGEAVLFSSFWIGGYAVLIFLINSVYFIALEEPGLEKRFGAEYVEYKKHVPRWVPRLRGWRPG